MKLSCWKVRCGGMLHLLSGSSITVSRHHAPKCLHVTSSHPGGVLQVPRPPSCSVQGSVQCQLTNNNTISSPSFMYIAGAWNTVPVEQAHGITQRKESGCGGGGGIVHWNVCCSGFSFVSCIASYSHARNMSGCQNS